MCQRCRDVGKGVTHNYRGGGVAHTLIELGDYGCAIVVVAWVVAEWGKMKWLGRGKGLVAEHLMASEHHEPA